MCDSGISILLTDHRERETLTITHRNYIICAGKVIVSGDAETVLRDRNAMREYFGDRFDGDSIIEGKVGLRLGGGEPAGSATQAAAPSAGIPATIAAAKTLGTQAPGRLTAGRRRPSKPD